MFQLHSIFAEELPKFFEFDSESINQIVAWASSIFDSFAPLLVLVVGLLVGVFVITFILKAIRS